MPPKAGGTPPGGKHHYAVPFASVRALLMRYRDRDAGKTALYDLSQDKGITFGELHDWDRS